MNRLLASLLAVTSLLVVLAAGDGGLAMMAALAAAFTIAAVVTCLDRRVSMIPHGVRESGVVAEERRLHGVFRRLSSPGAPGRPRPRAPGAGSRPA